MKLRPIIDYLEMQGYGTVGTDLFEHFMPAEIESGLLVTCQLPVVFDPYTQLRKGTMQVIARGNDYDAPRELMENIMVLFSVQGLELNDEMKFHYIYPKHEPLLFPKSDGDKVEASVNFEFAFSLT